MLRAARIVAALLRGSPLALRAGAPRGPSARRGRPPRPQRARAARVPAADTPRDQRRLDAAVDPRPASTAARSCRSGCVGATQGGYDQTQALLDISAGHARLVGRLQAQERARCSTLRTARTARRCSRAGSTRRAPRRRARPPTSCPGCSAQSDPRRRGRTPGSTAARRLESAARRRTQAGRHRAVSLGTAGDVAPRARSSLLDEPQRRGRGPADRRAGGRGARRAARSAAAPGRADRSSMQTPPPAPRAAAAADRRSWAWARPRG